jgi:hypothetical protein
MPPTRRGVTRRPNTFGGTTNSTISFAPADYIWASEQARARNITLSLVVADAIAVYRDAQEAEIARIEAEEKKARRPKLPTAPTDDGIEY